MAVSRLAVLLVVAALLIPATFLATRRGDDSGSGAAKQPVAAPQAAAINAPQSGATRSKEKQASAALADERRRALRTAAVKPGQMLAALERKRTVVLLFSDGRGADDAATSQAVRSLRDRVRGVSIFTDRLSNVGAYSAAVGNLGVSQSPSVVIVGPNRTAQVVEGYVDPETLLQQVFDARR